MPFAASAPTGWLLAFGQNVSRTTYADLFAAIGTTYGSGDGSSTFTLPTLEAAWWPARTIWVAAAVTGLPIRRAASTATLSVQPVVQDHTLTVSQLASHSHTLSGGIKTIVQGGSSFSTGLDKRAYTTNQGQSANGI